MVEDRVKKLEAQVTELKKIVEGQQKRIEEITELKKTVGDQQRRIDDLEKWPGTGDEAILKMFQEAEAQDRESEEKGEPSA
ncbi:hypothetical protein EYC84_005680 [Monilinia fructicola]|uniref:Uncharacterized protein n=1 Tax=Monilinia fructicola TaxID=38448 RepID=A0A5M9K5T4_MONFR|nr:hypothetical protein EYC84_005680 [Monilinia fructicola]